MPALDTDERAQPAAPPAVARSEISRTLPSAATEDLDMNSAGKDELQSSSAGLIPIRC